MFFSLIIYGLVGAGIGAGVGTVVSSTTDKWDQRNEYAGYGALAGGIVFALSSLVIEQPTRDLNNDYFESEEAFSRENPMRR